jgi:flagellar P-ring protein precursor FlgI
VQINQLNGGRISAGAIVERGVPTTFARDGYVYVELNNTDFGTAQNVAMALNRKFGQGTATALDGRVVQVRTPMDQASQARFLSQLEDLQVARAPTVAKVIINARTGSVVMNRTVMIEEAAVAHGNLSVIILSRKGRRWWYPIRRSRCARRTVPCNA